MHSAQARPSTSAPGDGSRTITVHDVQPIPDDPAEPVLPDGALRLRGGPPRRPPRVAWDERVVDNENCGRKKSKICCIYHKPKQFDESSSESSSSESDSDSSDDARARPRYASNRRHHHHHHQHPPAHPNGASDSGGEDGLRSSDDSDGVVHQIESPRELNAYETQPSHSKKGKDRVDGKYLKPSSTVSEL